MNIASEIFSTLFSLMILKSCGSADIPVKTLAVIPVIISTFIGK
jgi:hypothetical protein